MNQVAETTAVESTLNSSRQQPIKTKLIKH